MSLSNHLKRQRQCLSGLLDLLEEERRNLAVGRVDGERLNDLSERKRQWFEQLEQLESQRRHALQRLGYADTRQGSDQAARDAGCQDEWQSFRDMAERVRRLNHLNGEIIQNRLSHNQRLLNFLHEAADNGLYGADGQARRQGLGRVASRA
ncbi:flagella synthesis protein FlgN [Aidingimonas halophila]|uniref:Flagella synthesis protein FlgN n=1 Tax=Aidingimonas halophila TaxID=574349 RepID=A0A1H3B6W3_9GAMM|nr:flagellar protein FlgN [Aidingimonas halophila]GHC26020.1 flagella synthesis protein FlgN [Aidingimonas halophila]SDX37692.1 flagella synthesis protein FlgN [Aidingimonas halophila]